jgi:hypothetical protein
MYAEKKPNAPNNFTPSRKFGELWGKIVVVIFVRRSIMRNHLKKELYIDKITPTIPNPPAIKNRYGAKNTAATNPIIKVVLKSVLTRASRSQFERVPSQCR